MLVREIASTLMHIHPDLTHEGDLDWAVWLLGLSVGRGFVAS